MIVITLSLSWRIFSSFLSFSDHFRAAQEQERGNGISWWRAGWLVGARPLSAGLPLKNRLSILHFYRNFPRYLWLPYLLPVPSLKSPACGEGAGPRGLTDVLRETRDAPAFYVNIWCSSFLFTSFPWGEESNAFIHFFNLSLTLRDPAKNFKNTD